MEPDTQLELFNLPQDQAGRPRLSPIGCVRIRQDHAVLLAIGGLIGVSVVFAFGVERGKRLAKVEYLAPSASKPAGESPATPRPASSLSEPVSAEFVSAARASSAGGKSARPSPSDAAPAAAKSVAAATPKTTANGAKNGKHSQFAVQVVSYRQASLAQRELKRLKQRGEPAFLMQRQGKATLLVGPFATKETASARLTNLRSLYRDCFVRSF